MIFVDDEPANLLLADLGRVLGGEHDRVDPHRLVTVVFHGDLSLAVGPKPIDFPPLAGVGQPAEHLVGQLDRQRHQFGRVVAGVAEHQPLVARADLLPLGGVLVHSHGDVGALPVDREHHRAGVGANAHPIVCVADVADDLADDLGIVDHGLGRDLAGDNGDAGRDHRLAGHAAPGVLGEQGVEDAVGNLIGQLVGMAHADRFAGEQEFALGHGITPKWFLNFGRATRSTL